jgi:hypothetical protein
MRDAPTAKFVRTELQITFDEFWSLRSKSRQKRRQREVKIKVVKAENILNAGARADTNASPCLPCFLDACAEFFPFYCSLS